jgi:outer membrane protein OmpA-like peptidoglycan-associated protein
MNTASVKAVWAMGLVGISTAALADAANTAPPKTVPPQEPAGFIAGGVIGGFAAGPVGAVIGAGLGTWLGKRVHRAGEAAKAQAQVATLETEKKDLAETNRALTARLDELSQRVETAQTPVGGAALEQAAGREDSAKVLDGLQGDVLFRTGSAEITAETAHEIEVLAGAVAKSPGLKVRVDGYADPRGTVDANLKLSEARADAVRDLFLEAGVSDEALEVNAYGKSQSVALDSDGYALERRVRLTLQAAEPAAVAQSGAAPPASGDARPADTARTSGNE